MAAPYPFLYHHRAILKEYEKKATGLMKQHLLVLLEFLQSEYSAEYLEADGEFSKGIVTDKHIEKLFRPNEIVVEKSEGHEMAYVVREWPEILENELAVGDNGFFDFTLPLPIASSLGRCSTPRETFLYRKTLTSPLSRFRHGRGSMMGALYSELTRY
jgi:hypothetical protein